MCLIYTAITTSITQHQTQKKSHRKKNLINIHKVKEHIKSFGFTSINFLAKPLGKLHVKDCHVALQQPLVLQLHIKPSPPLSFKHCIFVGERKNESKRGGNEWTGWAIKFFFSSSSAMFSHSLTFSFTAYLQLNYYI